MEKEEKIIDAACEDARLTTFELRSSCIKRICDKIEEIDQNKKKQLSAQKQWLKDNMNHDKLEYTSPEKIYDLKTFKNIDIANLNTLIQSNIETLSSLQKYNRRESKLNISLKRIAASPPPAKFRKQLFT